MYACFPLRGDTYSLAAVVVIWMTVAPIPVRLLVPLSLFGKRPVVSVTLLEIPAIGMVFVVIPIVIVLVITVVDSIAVLIVSMIFFLASAVLRLGPCIHCRWHSKSSSKNKRTEKILISSVHIFILLA
jgi:hypothetical protein